MSPLHWAEPGLQTPPHCPAPLQTNGHPPVVVQMPELLHVCTLTPSLAHRRVPGEQEPVHWPLTHAVVQVVPDSHCPWASQVCGVIAEHWRAVGTQTPVHAPAWQT
jgi:hypothetical protein